MAQSYPLENKKVSLVSLRGLIRPMLLLSLAIHGILLFTPLSSQNKAKQETAPEEEKITLTQLPPANQPTPQPSTAARPKPRQIPRVNVPRRRVTAPSVRRSAPPALPTPRSPVQVAPAAPSAAANPNAFLANFPRYPGAQRGSFGLPEPFNTASQKTTDQLTNVRSWFDQQLQAKGYSAQITQNDSSRVVFQVSKEGTTQYLTLIPSSEGAGTNILLTSEQLPTDLGGAAVEDPAVTQFFQELPIPHAGDEPDSSGNSIWQNSSADQLSNSNQPFFYDVSLTDADGNPVSGTNAAFSNEVLKNGIRWALVASGQADPQALFTQTFSENLQIGEYEVKPLSNYGGGALYQISRDGMTAYLSLVPTMGGDSTAIFVWEKAPQ